jgi:peptide/nickel transport system substrate-binding protein
MRRRQFIAASAAALTTAALARPAIAQGEKSAVLKFVPYGDLGSVDPIWTGFTVTRCHGFMVFDTLYGQAGEEEGFATKPQMVAGHTVEDDGRTWKMTLRDGLMFHDGTKVLARDCVASIRRWSVRDSFGQALMKRTNEISAPDDRTIVFRLKTPFPLLPDALGKFSFNMCAIMPERLASTDPFKQITEVIGSGPFRFKADEQVQGSRYVYQRFSDYKPRENGTPGLVAGPKIVHFDRVEWHIIPDQATVSAALQTGEIDWQEYPINDLIPMLRRNANITVTPVGALGWCWALRPNHLFPPFDNPAIRRVILSVIDQTEYLTAAMDSDPTSWRVPAGFFPVGSPMASDAGMAALTASRDFGKARRELEAAGYQGENVVAIVPGEGWALKAMCDVAVDMLRQIGMTVDYQVIDYTSSTQRVWSKNPPAQGGWNIRPTASQGLDLLTPATHWLLRGNGEQGPTGWPSSPKLEALREQWLDAPDFATQKRVCAEIQSQAFIGLPYWPLGTAFLSTAYRADLTGVIDGQPIFWNVRRS